MHKRKQLQTAVLLKKDPSLGQLPEHERDQIFKKMLNEGGERPLNTNSSMGRLTSAGSNNFQFGRSIQSGYHKDRETEVHMRPDSEMINPTNYTIRSVERVFSAFPQKKPPKKDKKAMEEEKKRQEEEEAANKLIPRVVTTQEALKSASGWANSVSIHKKYAVGTVTTSKYQEKTGVFQQVNDSTSTVSNIYPMSNYYGKKPNPNNDPNWDPYNRRVTKQLNDIDFEEDSEDDFEDVRNLKRQPRTVLTEENLRKYLSYETTKLNLEHHYWLKDSFLGKIGHMATNLQVLSLRRLKISNESFVECMHYLKKLERLDISSCPHIGKSGLMKFFENCGNSFTEIQASDCSQAIDDDVLKAMVECKIKKEAEPEDSDDPEEKEEEAPMQQLNFIDISYAKEVTDEGLNAFMNLPNNGITHLCLNGVTGVTGKGLYEIINSCKDTLTIYESAQMDQDELKDSKFAKALAYCFNLQCLDLGGCKAIGDDFFNNIAMGERKEEGITTKPGFAHLHTIKLNFLTRIMDGSATKCC